MWNGEVIQVFYKLKMRETQVRTHCLHVFAVKEHQISAEKSLKNYSFKCFDRFTVSLLQEQDGSASFAGMPTPLLDPTKKEFEASAWRVSTVVESTMDRWTDGPMDVAMGQNL